jgi:hypothetical protein
MKPKLFQDVDGCLLVHNPVSGYLQYTHKLGTYWYAPYVKERLHYIAKLFDIVWSSNHWNEHIESAIVPLFDLPKDITNKLNYSSIENHGKDMLPEKLDAITGNNDGGPCAIVDDRMGTFVETWASDKLCLLIKPENDIGITVEAFNLLTAYGEMFGINRDAPSAKLLQDFLKATAVTTLFIYGSFRSQGILDEAAGQHVELSASAMLGGYRRVCGTLTRRSGTFCNLVEDANSEIGGRVVYVTESVLKNIDRWEARYYRKPVTLLDGIAATVYCLRDECRHELSV